MLVVYNSGMCKKKVAWDGRSKFIDEELQLLVKKNVYPTPNKLGRFECCMISNVWTFESLRKSVDRREMDTI